MFYHLKKDILLTHDLFEKQLKQILNDDITAFNTYINQFSNSKTRKEMTQILEQKNGSTEHVKNIFKTKSCPICADYIINPVVTACGHIYCSNCLMTSYKTNKSCPTCRCNLKLTDIYKIKSDKVKVDGCKNRATVELLKNNKLKWVIIMEQPSVELRNCYTGKLFDSFSKRSDIESFNNYSGPCCCIVNKQLAKRVFNPDCIILWDDQQRWNGEGEDDLVARDNTTTILHQYTLKHSKD